MFSVGSHQEAHQAPEDSFKLMVIQMILSDSQKPNKQQKTTMTKVMTVGWRLVGRRGSQRGTSETEVCKSEPHYMCMKLPKNKLHVFFFFNQQQ